MNKLLLLLLLSLPLSAMERIQGWCEQGSKVVVAPAAVGGSPVSRNFQQSYPRCTVQVYLTGSGGIPATIYANNTNTVLSNPFTADSLGHYFFYVPNGRYDVQLSGGGLGTPYTIGDILSYDPSLSGPNGGVQYLYAHFRDDDQYTLRLSYSGDTMNWSDVNKAGSFSINPGVVSMRDPSVTYYNGTFYFTTSPDSFCKIPIITSTDLVNFTVFATIDMGQYIPGCTGSWAPEFWHDPNNGNYYLWVPINTSPNPFADNPFTPYLVQLNLAGCSTSCVIGAPTQVTLNGTTSSRNFDLFPYYVNGTYYLFYVDQQPGLPYSVDTDLISQPIAFATSTSLTGPYTQQTSANTDYFGFGAIQNPSFPGEGIITDGDSITYGYLLPTPATQSYPAQALVTKLPPTYQWTNPAIPGYTSVDIINHLATNIIPQFAKWGTAKLVYSLMIGTNDLNQLALTPAQSYANLQTICTTVTNVGASMVVFTLLPSSNNGGFETWRQSYNTLIRNGGACHYTVADVGSNATIGQAGQNLNLTYYYEGTHPTPAGDTIIATYLTTAINNIPPNSISPGALRYQTEAPTLIQLQNGCTRIIVDTWILQPVGNGTSGRTYTPKYKDSCPNLGPLFSQVSLTPAQSLPPNMLGINAAEQGTVLNLGTSTAATEVLNSAAAIFTNDYYTNTNTGVGTSSPFYTLTIKQAPNTPAFILYNGATTLAWDAGDGTTANLSACGAGANTCALPYAGSARLEMNSSSPGIFGMFQFNQAQTDTQEASIALADGVGQFGSQINTSSASGMKAVWTVGENSQLLDTPVANHKFFLYNAGIDTTSFVKTGPKLGTLTNFTNGCAGMQITVGASPISVIGMGRWVLPTNATNHYMYLLNSTGAIVHIFRTEFFTNKDGSQGVVYLGMSVSNGRPGTFSYIFDSPVTLSANTVYYVMSQEVQGGDGFYDSTTQVTTSSVATVTNAAYQGTCGTGSPIISGGAGHSYGPVDFIYSTNSQGFTGGFPLEIDPSNPVARFNWGITFGSGDNSIYNHAVYGSIDSLGSTPSTPRINMGNGTPGSTNATVYASSFVGTGGGGGGSGCQSMPGYYCFANNATGAYGIMQVASTTANSGEASMVFGDGMSFGTPPVSSAGNIALWEIGENNQAIAAGPGNHLFFISNFSTGPQLQINALTEAVRVTGTLTFGGGPGHEWGQDIYGNIDVNGFAGINMGTGSAGNRNQVVNMGVWTTNGGATQGFYNTASINVAGSYGFLQLGNKLAGTGEASIMVGTGITAFGNPPSSSEGNAAIWTFGTNNQALTAGSGNHIFSIQNKGAGPALQIQPVSETVRVTTSLVFGYGLGNEWGQDVYASIDAQGSNGGGGKRINFGQGTPGQSNATLVSGAVDVSKYIASRGGVNTDLTGALTLSGGGTATYAFQNAASSTSICIAGDTSGVHPVQAYISGVGTFGTLNLVGTASDNVVYHCFAHEF